jgi:hypothetical protein
MKKTSAALTRTHNAFAYVVSSESCSSMIFAPLSHGRGAPSAAARWDLWLAFISGVFRQDIGLGKTDPSIRELRPIEAGHMLRT